MSTRATRIVHTHERPGATGKTPSPLPGLAALEAHHGLRFARPWLQPDGPPGLRKDIGMALDEGHLHHFVVLGALVDWTGRAASPRRPAIDLHRFAVQEARDRWECDSRRGALLGAACAFALRAGRLARYALSHAIQSCHRC